MFPDSLTSLHLNRLFPWHLGLMGVVVISLFCYPTMGFPSVIIQPISDTITIKIPSFNTSIDSLINPVDLGSPPIQLLVDLRDNPGGSLRHALSFAATFVPTKTMIHLKKGATITAITRPANHPFIKTDRMIILINHRTASAAEACALALSNHPQAIIIGTNSMGKSGIQNDTHPSPEFTDIVYPESHIVPDIFYKWPPNTPNESVYMMAIQLANTPIAPTRAELVQPSKQL